MIKLLLHLWMKKKIFIITIFFGVMVLLLDCLGIIPFFVFFFCYIMRYI